MPANVPSELKRVVKLLTIHNYLMTGRATHILSTSLFSDSCLLMRELNDGSVGALDRRKEKGGDVVQTVTASSTRGSYLNETVL